MSDRSRDSSSRVARGIRRGRSSERPAERAAGLLLGLFLVLAPLSGGGILAGFAVPVALAATVVWGVAVWAASQRDEGYRVVPVAGVALALAALALLRSSHLGSALAAPWTASSSSLWPSLPESGALAPGGGAAAAVRLVGFALVADASALRLGTTSGFRTLLLAGLLAASLAMVVGVAHEAAGATALYGTYRFPAASHFVPLAAPFSNPNVAGSLACLGALCAWGLGALQGDRPAVRLGWSVAGLLLVAHASRLEAFGALSATVTALVAGAVALALVRWVPRRQLAKSLVVLPVMAAVASVAAVVAFAPPALVGAGAGVAGGKLIFWQRAYGHLGEAGLFGFGPGSFHDFGARILPLPGGYRPAFTESEPAQLIFDHGWLAAAAIAVVALWLVGTTISRLCAAQRPGYGAAVSVLTTWVLVDALFGMAWESVAFAAVVLSMASAVWRMARPLEEREGLALRGWLVGAIAALCLLAAFPNLSASTTLGQERGKNPFAGTDRSAASAAGAWRDRVMEQARLSPAAPIVVAEEGRRALAAGDKGRAAEMAAWLREAAPMDETALAFRINEAEARTATDEVCSLTKEYLSANNPYLVRPRFWLRLGKEVGKWVPCLPVDSKAEEAAISFLRRNKRNDEALALTLGLMARSPRNLATIDAGFSISLLLRRFESAAIFLQQRAAIAPDALQTAAFGIQLDLARESLDGLLARVGTEISRFPADSSLRLLRLSAIAALAHAGKEPADAVGLVEEDGRELRIATGGEPVQLAQIAMSVGEAYAALHLMAEATRQFDLARSEPTLRDLAQRKLDRLARERGRSASKKPAK